MARERHPHLREIADLLFTARKDANLTGSDITKQTSGLYRTKISQIETAQRLPTAEDIEAWADICKVSESRRDELKQAQLRATQTHRDLGLTIRIDRPKTANEKSPPPISKPHLRTIAKLLFEARDDAGLKNHELAKQCGWDNAKVSKLEKGHKLPTVHDVKSWANICGLNADQTSDLLAVRKIASRADRASKIRTPQPPQRYGPYGPTSTPPGQRV